ncbi:hypothetical protein [Nocardia sp. CA-120079]|uniref:hypothetical protein n=1 Tax=Nocardia sp. CA-120079 TaxID=3239974 RepID=UPI003D974B8B
MMTTTENRSLERGVADTAVQQDDPALIRRRTITGVLVLPLFFLIALPGLFLGALHAPAPHDMKVAIIGDGASSDAIATQLSARATGFEIHRVVDAESARNAVRERDIRAAYDPATGDLFLASAGGAQATEAARALFSATAQSSGTTVRVHDVVALPASDRLGTSALYVGIGAIVGGFLSGLVIAMVAPTLRVRWQLLTLVVMSMVIAGIETCYGWVIFGMFPGNVAASAAVLAGTAAVAGLVTLAGMRAIGPAMVMVSILVLILAGVTASGLPVQLDMAPDFYRWMHEILPTPRALSALRGVAYFGGDGITGDLVVMGIWGLAGLIVLALTRHRTTVPGMPAMTDTWADEAVVVGAAASAAA